jgi:hypothetical protein
MRERYDEALAVMADEESIEVVGKTTGRREGHFLPDWTKGIMCVGAPNAAIIPPTEADDTEMLHVS